MEEPVSKPCLENHKRKSGGGVIKCQKPRHEVLLQMKSHNHPALISSHLCVSITMLIFLSNTGGYGQTIFFFLLKQFSRSCYLHPWLVFQMPLLICNKSVNKDPSNTLEAHSWKIGILGTKNVKMLYQNMKIKWHELSPPSSTI